VDNGQSIKVAVVILAGGRGSRIGGGKPLLRLGGRTLLDHALMQARQWSRCIAVAAGGGIPLDDDRYPAIVDEPQLDGPLAGLAAALRFAGERGLDAALTIPVDTPFLPADLLPRLVSAIGPRNAAVSVSNGRLHATCGLWRVSALDRLPAYVETGRRALMGLAEAAGFVTVEWPAEPFDPFFNINTAADLAEAERLLLNVKR
jgi:molybdopterin-guanine dinucleotide biosynthesis protein A